MCLWYIFYFLFIFGSHNYLRLEIRCPQYLPIFSFKSKNREEHFDFFALFGKRVFFYISTFCLTCSTLCYFDYLILFSFLFILFKISDVIHFSFILSSDNTILFSGMCLILYWTLFQIVSISTNVHFFVVISYLEPIYIFVLKLSLHQE